MFPVPKCAQVPSCEFGSVPCAAGGEFGLSNGDWFDSVRSQVCKSCPILPSQNTTDPALVICEGNTVKSQPGYYSYFLEEPYPYAELALAQCPNLRACKNEGFVNSTCANSLSVCNGNSNLDKTVLGKCAEGYTGTNMHAHQAYYLNICFAGMLCAQCDNGWFSGKLVRSPSIMQRAHHMCAQSALECKTCANASLLVVVAIVSTLGVYAIGVVLGQKAVGHVDSQVEDPNLKNGKVGLHSCSAVLAVY